MSGVMMKGTDEFEVATTQLLMLEQRIAQVKRERRAQLERYVFIDHNIRQFFYTTDEFGYIAVQQDAPFVACAIVVSGNNLGIAQATTAQNFSLSIEDLGSGRQVTEGSEPLWPPNFHTSLTPATMTLSPGGVLTVAVEEFSPTYRQGDDYGTTSPNTDYWHVLGAQWLIPKGDTLRCLFKPTGTAVIPNVTLCGFKVMG